MSKRIRAVLLAYFTRRLLWLWFALAGVLSIAIAVASWKQSKGESAEAVSFRRFTAMDVSTSVDLQRLIAENREHELQGLDCHRSWDQFGPALDAQKVGGEQGSSLLRQLRERKQLPEFDRFPNLRVLNLDRCVIFPDDAERLARCQSLEWLSMQHTVVIDRNVSFLSQLKRLDTLILDTLQSAPEQPLKFAAEPPPRLSTLQLGGSPWDQPQALAALSAAPLRTLAIQLSPKSELNRQAVEAIREISTLQQIFVGGYEESQSQFRELTHELSHVRVWHRRFSVNRIFVSACLLYALLAVGAAVLTQVQSTFVVPQSRLWPNYVKAHIAVPVLIGVGAIVLLSTAATFSGVHFKAVFSAQFAISGMMILLSFTQQAFPQFGLRSKTSSSQLSSGVPSKTISQFFGMALLLLFFGGFLWAYQFPYMLESFVLGEMPGVELTLFLGGLALAALSAPLVTRFCVGATEAGLSPLLTFADMQRRQWRTIQAKIPFHLAAVEPASSDAVRWRRWVSLLRAGNPNFLYKTIFASAWIVLIWIVAEALIPAQLGFIPSEAFTNTFRGGIIGGSIVLSLQSALVWWQRRRTFQVELLRPWTRRQLMSAVFAGVAADLALSLTFVFVVFLILNGSQGWGFSTTSVVAIAFAGLAIWALLAAGVFALMTVRHGLLAFLIGYAGCVGVAILMALLIGALRRGADVQASLPLTLPIVAATAILFTMPLAYLAYRRWMRMEWAMIAPP